MMGGVLGRRRWWATRLVACYALACAALGVLHVAGAGDGLGEALVVLALPTSLLALSLVSAAEMVLNGVILDDSPAWTVVTIVVWTLALIGQTTLVARLVLDDSRTVRGTRASRLLRLLGSPRRWTLRGLTRAHRTTNPPGHGPTVRI